ncbi:hypothetical protein DSO57_1009314 [Entomophthora muscae]|uniref:Uncharacterized protein n=1 Tax=Entomophthora muscae TaxID=34485 RepID=A0ACC2RLJ1_9FUNG|nr:hypothetical protein DSO57_1009314 [Entomophthora muscae]
MRTGEATPWMKLSKFKEEVLTAIKSKLPLKDAEIWVATEYFLGFVPRKVAGEVKGHNMRAQDITEFFPSFQIPSLAIG